MTNKTFLQNVKLQNFLSYGSNSQTIELKPLNVLIGTNASGKSNLIEAFSLLKSTPQDLSIPIIKGGGLEQWLWKGKEQLSIASMETIINYEDRENHEKHIPLKYRLSFTMVGQKLEIIDEVIENESKINEDQEDVHFYYRYQNGKPALNYKNILEENDNFSKNTRDIKRQLKREDINFEQSILSQKKDSILFPELTYLGNKFSQFKIYQEWNVGRYTPPRKPQPTDLPNNFLLEDASNLALVINNLEYRGLKPRLLKELQKFYPKVEDIYVIFNGNTAQIFIKEKDLTAPISAYHLSDGTLRYLCLLSILLHPSPPPLICIEEPEICLHPDIIPNIAELLIEASQKTQLIITTHSDALVSGLSEIPESILVCERNEEGTYLKRLESKKLKQWLEDYTLGDLWRMGEIGGYLK